jgi:hypothetical protein
VHQGTRLHTRQLAAAFSANIFPATGGHRMHWGVHKLMQRCIAIDRIPRSRVAGNCIARNCIAIFLLIGFLLPIYGPLLQASVSPSPMPCCRRRSLDASASQTASAPPGTAPAMHCHHGAQSEQGNLQTLSLHSEVSVRSLDCCCYHCDCCQNAKISVWAAPVSGAIASARSLSKSALLAQISANISTVTTNSHSPRAPPRA